MAVINKDASPPLAELDTSQPTQLAPNGLPYIGRTKGGRLAWTTQEQAATTDDPTRRVITAPDAGIDKSESPLPSEVEAIAIANGWPVIDPIEVVHPTTAPGGTGIRHYFERSDGTGGTPTIRKVSVDRDSVISATPNQDDFYPDGEPVVAPNVASDYISSIFVNDSESVDYGYKRTNLGGAWVDVPPPNSGGDYVTNPQLATEKAALQAEIAAAPVNSAYTTWAAANSGGTVAQFISNTSNSFDNAGLF